MTVSRRRHLVVSTPNRQTGALKRNVWTSRRALISHAAILIWVVGCSVAAWWQVGIALSGDNLGWVYSVMWPCFAVFGVVFWWFLIHDDPETIGRRGLRRLEQEAPKPSDGISGQLSDRLIERAEQEDPDLAAYNAYLAQLAQQDGTRSGRSK